MLRNSISVVLLLMASGFISCSNETAKYPICGSISDPVKRILEIDGQSMQISVDGTFHFEREIERPIFLDINYANLKWSVFLQPGSSLDIQISGRSLDAVEYGGDLASCNTYLLGVESLTQEINAFLNQNWVQIHLQNQVEYVSTLDSLKGLYREHLVKDPNQYRSFSKVFTEAWLTEIHFAFNKLILYYPQNHVSFTGKWEDLSDQSISYIKLEEIDRPEYIDLPSYNDYTEDWIDFQAKRQLKQEHAIKHFNLMKMDALTTLIPRMFTSQYLRDYWYTRYLKTHIETNGLQNSQPYIGHFETSCNTPVFRNEMAQYLASVKEQRADHEIKTYKTANTFELEAHIFRPGDLHAGEKSPAIVIFHGGGWNSGNPSWAFERARHFQDLGMVAIAAQYRLANLHDITAIESMSDARDLILWMRSHADSLHIDPDRIAAYGWSAGAHLVSSAAIFSESIQEKAISSIPDAMILVSPAVSLPKGKGWEGWKFNVFGATTTVSSANPVEHVREELPPTIILQGKDDTVTPLDGVQAFHDEMLAHGNYCELFIYDGVGHLFTPSTMPDNMEPHPDKEIQEKAFDQADLFLQDFGFVKK